MRLGEDCLRRRCAWQCRDGARPVSTVFAGQEIATEQTVPAGLGRAWCMSPEAKATG
ncbi:MAG: hypothetical protein LBD59_04895 [Prevotellaceae bacterium]|nr:hypothetical protein [Prevotellaceae bacterium]